MNADDYQVPGLRNLGNTCFLNCILQALAPSSHLKSYLRQAICAFGPDAPDVAVALLESLEDLAPVPHARCCPPVSPGPLLSVLRQHVRADVLTDGEQNDAVEALEVLLGALVSQLQSTFLHGRGPELTSLSARHAISKGAEHQALFSTISLTQLQAVKSAPCTHSDGGSDSQQGRSIEHSGAVEGGTSDPQTAFNRSMESKPGIARKCTPEVQASSSADPHRIVSLQLKVADNGLPVTATLAVTASGTTFGTADGQGQTEAIHSADAQSSKTFATAGAEFVSSNEQHNTAPQHAPEQAHMPPGDSMLQAWRALSRLPLELALQHEAACARCRRPSASHVSAMLALPLTLPTVEGRWGPVLKPGMTLHHALATYFSRDLVQDAVCTHCSLRATLEQAPPAINMHTACQPSPWLPTHADGPPQTMDSPPASVSPTSQGAVEKDADACAFPAARGGNSFSYEGVSRGSGIEGAAEKLVRLRGLLHGGCAPPDCDYMQLAAEVGLPWSERRAPLLTRAVLARSPQVLCLQLRRVLWTRRGRLAKVPGRVAFPEELNLAPYTAAEAEPLLPVARPLVSHPLASLSSTHHAPDLAHPSMRSRGGHGYTATAPIAAPSQSGTCSDVRHSNDSPSAVPERGEQNCTFSTGIGSADGGELASAAAKVVEQQSGAAVRLKWKPERGAGMLYGLAAVIVHHGGAQSGHYTVYRKASVEQDDSCVHAEAAVREGYQQQAVNNAFINQVRFGDCALGSGACTDTGKSSWLHASDEDVRTATLAEVLSSEAAVLLYERAPR
ncbi:probable ubiquitin carboxyl-terminal hydrolase 27 at N-terminal half [Coccomyxa sp. Obi]|nr:probable ubiquitin carboxyl-terminal hydrolase 27 at N-terminal half [Coccomyxa sp. Obi]